MRLIFLNQHFDGVEKLYRANDYLGANTENKSPNVTLSALALSVRRATLLCFVWLLSKKKLHNKNKLFTFVPIKRPPACICRAG